MEPLKLDDGLTIRTAFPDRYRDLVEQRKLFPLMYDLFLFSLVIGILRSRRHEGKREGDIVRLGQIKSDETVQSLEILCSLLPGEDQRARWGEALAYADGGLDEVWKEVETLGHLEVLRFIAEAKEKWPSKLESLLEQNPSVTSG